MPYIGNTIRAADDYRLIDDISSGFNGSETSFALQVAGSAPVPFPKSPQQVLISVNGVIQEPDPTGNSGFNLVGTNIVFSSAPTNGHAFFGIIYATADYLNAGGTFPAGATGSPSITFISDEDTGFYRKGSGDIGVVSNSSEIANFDGNGMTISSGNVGIGTSSATNQLHIYDNTAANDTPELKIESFRPSIRFKDRSSNSASAEIVGDNSLIFRVSAPVDDNTALTQRMVIESSGNIVANFDGSSETGQFQIADGSASSPGLTFWADGSADTGIFRSGANTLGFSTGGSTAVTVNSSQNVGIGVSSPELKLHVRDGALASAPTPNSNCDVVIEGTDNTGIQFLSSNQTQLRFGDAASTAAGAIIYQHSDDQFKFNYNSSGSITFNSSATARMTLDSSGRLLVGTTTEGNISADNLTVADSGAAGITVRSGTSNSGNLFFSDGTSGGDEYRGYLVYQHSTNKFDIGTNASTRLSIASDGKLTHTYDIGTNGNAGLVLNTDDGTKASSILFQANSEDRARIDVQRLSGDGGQLKIQVAQMDNSNTMLDAITIAPTSSGDTTPNVTLSGSLLLGTTDASGMIHARTNVASSSNFADNNAAVPSGNQYIHISNSNTGGNEQAGFVMNASGSASAIGAIYVHKTNSYLGSMVFRMRTNALTSASRMEIDSQGNIGAPNGTNIHNASDARVKKNVADLDKGLSAIKSLRPVSFNWIDGFCDKEKNTLYGFIAQEVENVDGNLIQQFGNGSVTVEGETINDTLRVNEKFIIPMLVKAIQELEAKVAALEAA